MVAMRWGMVPHFAKSLAEFKGFSTINAKECKGRDLALRSDLEGSVSAPAMPHFADGFYEWKRVDAKTKQPYAFAMRSGEPFAFGGLWNGWKDPATGDWLQSFSIITTDPNELTATVHDRMPVILKPSDYDRWLNRTDAERPPVDLLRPYEAAEMTAHEVDPRAEMSAMTNLRFAISGNVHQTLRNEMHHVQWLEERERCILSGPKKPVEVPWKSVNTRIFSCVGNIVGHIAYYRHILLIFQK